MLVHLQGRDGPHVVDASLDGSLKGAGLHVTIGQDHHLAGAHHGTNTNGEGVSRHVLGLAAEETAVGNAGVGGEGLHAGLGAQRGTGLVKGDMTIGADTSDEEVDAASFHDHLLVVLALSSEVGGIAVEDVDVLLRTVDMIEQVTSHEGMIALGMGLGQTNILVHVKGDHVLEGHFSGTVGLYEGIVHADGRRTGGKAQHELVVGCRVELVDTLNNVVCCPL